MCCIILRRMNQTEPYAGAIARQMLAALDMLANAIDACPEDQWTARLWLVSHADPDLSAYWYIAFHVLFWLDLYLEGDDEGFAPPEPFTLSEYVPAGMVPAPAYTKDMLRAYIAHCRAKIRARVGSMSDADAAAPTGFSWLSCSYLEAQLYNLRHLHEHAAQLSMWLGQRAGIESRWVKFG
jgi:hypothetical protein